MGRNRRIWQTQKNRARIEPMSRPPSGRPTGRPRKIEDEDAVRKLHFAGFNVREIALHFGCSRRLIWEILSGTRILVEQKENRAANSSG